ncbi:MAG: hypothetical protein L0Z53_24910, partial [Acidobacteriales bacterium]|nr:hypothetical protein [Terriglobales bacterium]
PRSRHRAHVTAAEKSHAPSFFLRGLARQMTNYPASLEKRRRMDFLGMREKGFRRRLGHRCDAW